MKKQTKPTKTEPHKITSSDNWPFFHAYHDSSYIQSHDTRKAVVLKEKGESRAYRMNNPNAKELVAYKIDHGLINVDTVDKCDFGIYSEDKVMFLVELKGADYEHALKQLLSTITILLTRPNVAVAKLHTRVVLSKYRVPDIQVTDEKKLTKLLKNRFSDGTHDKKVQFYEETV